MPDIEQSVNPDPARRARFEAIAEQVFEPLQRYLRRRASPADADDALSEVMLVIWRRLDDAPDDVLPWSYGIARLTLANLRRAQARHLRLVGRIAAEPRALTDPGPAESGPDAELSAALASLSEDDQDLLRLWAWEHLEPREIAPALGLSPNAATLRLSRARSRLADALTRQDRGTSGHQRFEGTKEAR